MVARQDDPRPKPVHWIGSSRDDLKAFPKDVQRSVGTALWAAQTGGKATYVKPLKGFAGAGVLEVVDDFDGDTYRAVYTVRFAGVVYVLHAFQKESKRGIATPRSEIEKVERRLKRAKDEYEQWQKKRESEIEVTLGSGNVFADLGFDQPEEELAKAKLAVHIWNVIRDRKLTQTAAGRIMGLDQPKVSALLKGRLANFSSDRLMRFLAALGKDVDIIVRDRPKSREHGRVRVITNVAA